MKIYTLILLLIVSFSAYADYEKINFHKSHYISAEKKPDFTAEELKYINEKKIIKMCIDPDWMPYEKIDDVAGYTGIGSDYHSIISEMTGLEYVIIKTKSWTETLDLAKQGYCDILSILNQTPERDKYLDFTQSYIESPTIFVTRSRDKFINGIDDLNDKTLALVEGYKIDEIIREQYPHITRIIVPNIKEALKLVSRGKAFATAGSLLEMSYTIRNEGMLNLKITGDAKFGYELRIGVKKGDKILLSLMNKALQNISKQDRDKILSKWISINYQKSYDYGVLWKFFAGFLMIFILIAVRYLITSKYNKKLLALNVDLTKAKLELEEANKNLELRVTDETAKRVENERILMQQSKLAAMGDMMGAIAHQWRQPLTAIGMYIQDIEDADHCGELSSEYLRSVVNDSMIMIKQMSNTINDFSNFFKPDKEKVCFNLCERVFDTVMMFKPQMDSHGVALILIKEGEEVTPDNIILGMKFDCNVNVKVSGYPNELQHVVLNLIKNSMDVLIEKNIQKKKICIALNVYDETMHLSFSDNGGGIDETIKDRIFEPYFTTKEEGKGVGIGLYMSKKIIENMGGKLFFKNSKEGAVFVIELKKFV